MPSCRCGAFAVRSAAAWGDDFGQVGLALVDVRWVGARWCLHGGAEWQTPVSQQDERPVRAVAPAPRPLTISKPLVLARLAFLVAWQRPLSGVRRCHHLLTQHFRPLLGHPVWKSLCFWCGVGLAGEDKEPGWGQR